MTDVNFNELLKDAFESVARHQQAEPIEGPIFHYTSAEAFKSIIEGNKLWLTNAAYLNDPAELSYPLEVARRVAEESDSTKTLQEIQKVTRSEIRPYESWYSTSFSMSGDDLSQWRAYCVNGGYSIGFDCAALSSLNKGFMCGPVEYDEARQRVRFRQTFEYYSSQNQRLSEMYPNQRHLWHERLVRQTSALLTRASILCKAKAFEVEKEWRIGLNESVPGVNGMHFTIRNHRIVPYIELPLGGELPISKIYVSPIGDQEIALEGARVLLQAKRYAPSIVHSSSFRLR